MSKNDHIPPSLQRFISSIVHPGNQASPPGLLGMIAHLRAEASREAAHANEATAAKWALFEERLTLAHESLQSACEAAVATPAAAPAKKDQQQQTQTPGEDAA